MSVAHSVCDQVLGGPCALLAEVLIAERLGDGCGALEGRREDTGENMGRLVAVEALETVAGVACRCAEDEGGETRNTEVRGEGVILREEHVGAPEQGVAGKDRLQRPAQEHRAAEWSGSGVDG
jgi:hypothetical protein